MTLPRDIIANSSKIGWLLSGLDQHGELRARSEMTFQLREQRPSAWD